METKDPKLGVPKIDQPQLQAGGGAPSSTARACAVDVLSPLVVKHLRTIYDELAARYRLETPEGQIQWLTQEQKGSAQDTMLLRDGSFPHFADYFLSGSANVMKPVEPIDDSFPLSNYFISSSHNTYLTGNQLSSSSSTDAYKNVLLRGCRCVEIDVWDGEPPSSSSDEEEAERIGQKKVSGDKPKLSIRKRLELRFRGKGHSSDDKAQERNEANEATSTEAAEQQVQPWKSNSSYRAEPQVFHGYTLTSEMPFREVCATIRKYAFKSSSLPLIVSLEVHTCPEQQEIMVELMNEYWGDMMINLPLDPSQSLESATLPTLKELQNKILVKVKRGHAKPTAAPVKPTTVQAPPELQKSSSADSTLSSATEASSDDLPEGEAKPVPKPKVIESLSKLGVYFGGYHFKSLDAPEASIPTHVFSLSEKSLMEVHETDPVALFHHNKHFFMRVYPKGLRVNSGNLNPSVFWRAGVQIVALNWQRWDGGMMQNEAMFADTAGYVLKPEGYRSASEAATQKTALAHHNLDLTIEFLAGQDIPLPPEEDDAKDFKPYVKVELHVEKYEEREAQPVPGNGRSNKGEYKKKTRTYRTPNPDFGREVISFEGVCGVTEELTFVRYVFRPFCASRSSSYSTNLCFHHHSPLYRSLELHKPLSAHLELPFLSRFFACQCTPKEWPGGTVMGLQGFSTAGAIMTPLVPFRRLRLVTFSSFQSLSCLQSVSLLFWYRPIVPRRRVYSVWLWHRHAMPSNHSPCFLINDHLARTITYRCVQVQGYG
jgi:hypothetical protein